MMQRMKIDISAWTIVKIVLILAAFYALYMVRDVAALLFIVLILVATCSATVDKWAKKITRPGAVIAVLLIILITIGAAIWLIIPPLISQSVQLVQSIPDYLHRISFVRNYLPDIKSNLSNYSSQLGNISSSLISFTTGIFGGIVAIVSGLVMFVYLLLDTDGLKKTVLSLFPGSKRSVASDFFGKVSLKAGNWMRGQLLLGAIIGTIDLIGLLIIGVPYALTLAVMSAFMELIPTIGPVISGLLAALVALSLSPIKAIIVIAMYILVQQLENNLIVPKVMQKAVGLSPAIIIVAILIGAKLYGIIGIILSVPIAASFMVLLQEWPSVRSLLEQDE